MAKINRYDTPAESNYFNTFVPLPLDQITALGMKRQSDLERKQDVASKYIDQASLVDYIANSKDEEWVKNEYMPKLQQYAEEAMSVDLTNPVEWAKYSTKLRGVGTSERIRRIEESKARWNDAQKIKQQLIANNKYNQLLDKDPAMGWDSENGVYNYMPQAYVDKAELFEQYYKHMKPRSKGVMNVGGVNVLREGIDANDVKTISAQAAQELAATPQGQQQIELFQKMYPDIAQNMNPVDILRMQMEDYGQQYIMSNDQVLPENLQGNGGNNPNPLISGWTPIATGGTGEQLAQDPAGVLQELDVATAIDKKQLLKNAAAAAGKAAMGAGQYADTTDYSSIELTKEMESKAVNKIISKYPELQFDSNGKKLSGKEIINQYKELSRNRMGGAIYVSNDPKMNEYLNSLLDNRYDAYKYTIPGTNENFTADEMAKKLGFKTTEAFRKAMSPAGPALDSPDGMSIIISPNSNNRYADAVKASGNQIVAVGDIGISNELKGIKYLKRAVETGQEGPIMIGGDENYNYGINLSFGIGERNGKKAFVPIYHKFRSTGKGDMELMYNIDNNGNEVPDLATMDEIYGEIVDNIFRGVGTSPYDMNLLQTVSSTGQRTVNSNR